MAPGLYQYNMYLNGHIRQLYMQMCFDMTHPNDNSSISYKSLSAVCTCHIFLYFNSTNTEVCDVSRFYLKMSHVFNFYISVYQSRNEITDHSTGIIFAWRIHPISNITPPMTYQHFRASDKFPKLFTVAVIRNRNYVTGVNYILAEIEQGSLLFVRSVKFGCDRYYCTMHPIVRPIHGYQKEEGNIKRSSGKKVYGFC